MAKLLHRIKIDKIGYGWVGLARMSDGKRIIIKWWALPGTIVNLKIVKQKKDYIQAHITEIVQVDPKIVDGEVFCPHFFSLLSSPWQEPTPLEDLRKIWCGGCKWQMLSYKNQLQLKEDIVNDAFTKIKKKIPELHVLSIIWSPQEKKYRNKIEFSFGKYITKWPQEKTDVKPTTPAENKVLSNRSCGFHKQGEFSKIVDITNCSLISDEANELFVYIKTLCKNSWLPVYDQMTHQWFFRHLVIREGTNTNQFIVNLVVSDDNIKTKNDKQRNRFLDMLKADEFLQEKVTSFVVTYNNGLADIVRSQESETKTCWWEWYMYEKLIFGNTKENTVHTEGENNKNTEENLSEITFRVSPFSFFQTNTLWAQQLFGKAMGMVGHVEWTILDLYCGTWSIGISFLKVGKWDKLVGIEIVEDAITDAWHNAKINGLDNKVLFLAAPAEKAFLQTPEIKNKLDNLWLVIIDPPRDGLHKNMIQIISDLKKESDLSAARHGFKLLYISCNPVTMVRDIELLVEWGFNIKEIQPVDMFPQTHHIECIGVLS